MTLRLRNLQVDVPAEVHDDAVACWSATLGATPRVVGGPSTHLDLEADDRAARAHQPGGWPTRIRQ